jgi:hypothetical protein
MQPDRNLKYAPLHFHRSPSNKSRHFPPIQGVLEKGLPFQDTGDKFDYPIGL